MSLSKMLWSIGLSAAGVVGVANAAHPTAPTYVNPYSPAPVLSAPAGPGCATPTLPGTIVPGRPAMPLPYTPGAVTPSTPGTLSPSIPGAPGTPSIPSTPGSVPSTPDLGPGAGPAVPGAGAAAAGAGAAASTGGGEGGSGGLATSVPNMIGDLGIKGFYRDARLPIYQLPISRSTVISTGSSLAPTGAITTLSPLNGNANARVSPLVANGQFRIIENESPRPQNRISLTFNYFDNVGGGIPGADTFNLYRSTAAFEQTFLDGNASFGARLPILYRDGGIGKNIDGFGDITLITKYAFLNDRDTGNVIGGGLAATIPLRELPIQPVGTTNGVGVRDINSVLWQPYVGFIANAERFYVQGFLSYVLPSNSIDTRFLSSDIAVGYKAYMNPGATITALIPTVEAHLINPLNNRSIANAVAGNANVGFTDQVVITGGVHVGLYDRTYITFAYGTPVTGPRLFDYEATVQLNFAY